MLKNLNGQANFIFGHFGYTIIHIFKIFILAIIFWVLVAFFKSKNDDNTESIDINSNDELDNEQQKTLFKELGKQHLKKSTLKIIETKYQPYMYVISL